MNPLPSEVDEKEELADSLRRPADAPRLDRGTVIGVVASVCLLLAVMVASAGSAAGVFWQTSSLALVLGGSVLATLASVPAEQLCSIRSVLRNTFYVRTRAPEDTIADLVRLAEIARRDGLLALEAPVDQIDDAFVQRAVRMPIDGIDAGTIEATIQAELEATDLRHAAGKGLLDSVARFAPIFGMIGTVMGLVIMLGHMDDPTKIGPGMAVALLTTLYGLVVANVFCAPLSRKLACRSSEELLFKMIVLRGVLSLQAGDHPRVLEQKLQAYLPASRRRRHERTRLPATPVLTGREPAMETPQRADSRRLVEAA